MSTSAGREGPEARVSWLFAMAAVLIGLAGFLLITGGRIVWPTYVTWLARGDPAQSWLGWQFFRQAPLVQWPLGANPALGLDLGNTVVFTDSIPLLALLFKPFSGRCRTSSNITVFGPSSVSCCRRCSRGSCLACSPGTGEQLDIGGKRLRPGRGFGAAQIGDDRLALAAILPVEVGKGEAAGIELVEDVNELRRHGETHEMAALTQEAEQRVEAAQGQLPALENAGEIAGNEAALNVRSAVSGSALLRKSPICPRLTLLEGRI
jgi:hypothetical protein